MIPMNSGRAIPAVGFGTWRAAKGETQAAVEHAISVGYRHIDCAYIYYNEAEVGAAIAKKIEDGTVKRSDLFITSKLWQTFHNPKDVPGAIQKSLSLLGLTYLDLWLVHWPIDYRNSHPVDIHRTPAMDDPADSDGRPVLDTVDKHALWEAMEYCVNAGFTKDIGLSNFNLKQVDAVFL